MNPTDLVNLKINSDSKSSKIATRSIVEAHQTYKKAIEHIVMNKSPIDKKKTKTFQ